MKALQVCPKPHVVSCCGAFADVDDPKSAIKEGKEAKGKGKSTGFVPSSAHFISFDADDATEKKKRKAAGSAREETAVSKMEGKSKVVEQDQSDDEQGEPSSPKAKPSKGKRAGGKKKEGK